MKVYAVEKGYYSGRHIVGIAETEDDANTIKKAISTGSYDDDSITITEFDTKQFLVKPFVRYIVTFLFDEPSVEYDEYNCYGSFADNAAVCDTMFVVYAKTPDEALKIGADMRAEYLARKEGIV